MSEVTLLYSLLSMCNKAKTNNYQNIRAKNLALWYQSAYGQQLQRPVIQNVSELLQQKPINSVLHMGSRLYGDFLNREKISQVYDLSEDDVFQTLLGDITFLPVATKSVDCVILMHELDISENPHQLLRESERVLADSGYLIIVGFNQLSLYGLVKSFTAWLGPKNEQCKFYNTNKIRDWLNLLNFEVEKSSAISYFFPISHPVLQTKLKFCSKLAARKGASFGNVYVLMAKKRITPITPIMFRWKKSSRLASTRLNPSSFAAEKRVYDSNKRYR